MEPVAEREETNAMPAVFALQPRWAVAVACTSLSFRFLVKILKMATSMLAGTKRPVFSSILLYAYGSKLTIYSRRAGGSGSLLAVTAGFIPIA